MELPLAKDSNECVHRFLRKWGFCASGRQCLGTLRVGWTACVVREATWNRFDAMTDMTIQ